MFNFSDIRERLQDQEQGSGNMPRAMLEAAPIIPEKYPDGTIARLSDFAGLEVADTPTNLMDLNWLQKSAIFNGNAYANFKIAKGLEFKTTIGVSNTDWREFIFSPTTVNLRSTFGKNRASLYTERRRFWQWENHLTYNTIINNIHALNIMVGIEYQKYHQLRYESEAKDLSDDFFSWNNLGQAQTQSIASSAYGWQMASYFARLNYTLQNKYLFTVTGRADGSSKFGTNNKWGTFPSVSVGWNITQESFMEKVNWLNDLKLSVGYGITGNQTGLDPYKTLELYGTDGVYYDTGSWLPSYKISQNANPDLKWEQTAMLNIGLDFSVLDSRLGGRIEWYNKKTSDMLYTYPVPTPPYLYSEIMANVGDMRNTGIELSLNADAILSLIHISEPTRH